MARAPHRLAPGLLLAAALAGCADQPCVAPLDVCGSACVDLRTDPLHCGACGNVCGTGFACAGGACVESLVAACSGRAGGAFVTLAVCGQSVKAWVTQEAFITRAEVLLAIPGDPGPRVPVFQLLPAADCDAQWTWHADPATALWLSGPPGACDACPEQIEAGIGYWLVDVGQWCPTAARVVAVDRR